MSLKNRSFRRTTAVVGGIFAVLGLCLASVAFLVYDEIFISSTLASTNLEIDTKFAIAIFAMIGSFVIYVGLLGIGIWATRKSVKALVRILGKR